MSRYLKLSQVSDPGRKTVFYPDPRSSTLFPPSYNLSEVTSKRVTPRKVALFSNDQELFIDPASPLIMISENAISTPSSCRFVSPVNIKPFNHDGMDTENNKTEEESKARISAHSIIGEDGLSMKSRPSHLNTSHLLHKDKQTDSPNRASIFKPENVDVFEDKEEEAKKEDNVIKIKIMDFLNSARYTYFTGIVIMYALFADDVRTVAFNASVDLGFDIVSLIALSIFAIEILLTFYAQKEYRWSFFFWLDLVSTVSIIFDVQFFSDSLFSAGAANTAQLARASRASRIGTKAGRVVRISKLVKFAKAQAEKKAKEKNPLVRTQSLEKVWPDRNLTQKGLMSPATNTTMETKPGLQKQMSLRRASSMGDPLKRSLQPKAQEEEIQVEELKESRVGKKLSDLTTKRVIVIILSLLILIPLFSADFYFDSTASQDYEMDLLYKILSNSTVSDDAKQAAIDQFISQETANEPVLIYLKAGSQMIYPSASNTDSSIANPSDLRDDEKNPVTITVTSWGDIISITNSRPKDVLQSGLNIGRTVFVCVILILGTLLFSKDTNDLVLRPIERMINKINKIAQNPLIAKDQALVRDKYAGFENETVQIENAIIKIGGLLALGFGDAGSAIIAQNIAKSGDLNPMLPGRKELAIFGFCDIRNFTDATEVLQEDVMVFVNSIAEVVHSVVNLYTGAANKNIGDAFLLVWKFPDSEILEGDDMELDLRDSNLTQCMADLALISFLKIHIKINRDPTLLEYRSNPHLNARLPNYKIKMGFGLHVGWAIEGAIGSEFKVDASYLSPNVNLASRLEAATKQYGVPLLFSGELYSRLSTEMQERSRLVDIVTVKGSVKPMKIYTVDVNANDMLPLEKPNDMTAEEKREKQSRKRKKIWDEITIKGTKHLLMTDEELTHAFSDYNQEFNNMFEDGFEAYIVGDWAAAKKRFEECIMIRKEDGPTKNLLEFMKENDYIPPEDWEGYHVLTEK